MPTVIQSAQGLVIFQLASNASCFPRTTIAPIAQMRKVTPSKTRSMRVKRAWSPRAIARAVCCVTTICRGKVGMHMMTARKPPKMPYSSCVTAWERKWTSHMNIPPPILAIISQPLWRKKEAPAPVSTGLGLSEVASAMGIRECGWQKVQLSVWKNSSSVRSACSSEAIEIHSSAVWACAMSPGPKTMLGMPPSDKIAASQK